MDTYSESPNIAASYIYEVLLPAAKAPQLSVSIAEGETGMGPPGSGLDSLERRQQINLSTSTPVSPKCCLPHTHSRFAPTYTEHTLTSRFLLQQVAQCPTTSCLSSTCQWHLKLSAEGSQK